MSFGFVDPWHQFLPHEGGHILSFMGSGGKTSLMRAVAAAYDDRQQAVILTTTTKCEVLTGVVAMTWAELQAAEGDSLPAEIFVHAGEAEPGKWQGLTAAQVDELGALLPERVVLAEVDGAAKQPLKLYRSGEPVWPARTSLAFVVMGVSAVGGQVAQRVHRWGRIDFPPLAGVADHALLEWSHLKDLLLAPAGYLAQVPEGVPAVLALGGLTEQDDSIGLFEFVGQAMAVPALPLVMFCALDGDELRIRMACVERDGNES